MTKKDEVWEFYGEQNPYFGVSTFEKFKAENLDDSAKDEFFQTGESHIQRIWQEIEENFCKDFNPQRAMDFGCGVGRLVIPLAKRCKEVVGIDISEKMLEESKKNSQQNGLENVEFFLSDENLSKVSGKFDLIHSFIVFQHINPEIGEKVFKRMLELLSDDGIGALQFTFKHPADMSEVFRFKLYRDYPIFYKLRKLLKGDGLKQFMPMYEYNLNRLFSLLKENNCHKCSIKFSHHGFDGVFMFFQKKKAEIY